MDWNLELLLLLLLSLLCLTAAVVVVAEAIEESTGGGTDELELRRPGVTAEAELEVVDWFRLLLLSFPLPPLPLGTLFTAMGEDSGGGIGLPVTTTAGKLSDRLSSVPELSRLFSVVGSGLFLVEIEEVVVTGELATLAGEKEEEEEEEKEEVPATGEWQVPDGLKVTAEMTPTLKGLPPAPAPPATTLLLFSCS